MKEYFYSSEDKEVFIYDTLESYQFNDLGGIVFENYVKGLSVKEIATIIATDFDETFETIQNDVAHLCLRFKELGLEPGHTGSKTHKNQGFESVHSLFRPHTPIVHIIQNCNSPCLMCDCWKTKEKIWHPARTLRIFFEKMQDLGATTIMVSGGEPLLHPELREIISDIKACGLRVMLNSNGLLLHKNMWLVEMEIDHLIISLDGYDPESYKKLRGINGFDIVLKNILAFKDYSKKTKLGFRTIVNRLNFNKLDWYFNLIYLHGLDGIGFSPADIDSQSFSRQNMDFSRTKTLSNLLLPTKEEITHFLHSFTPGNRCYNIFEEAAQNGISSWKPNDLIQCMLFYLNILDGREEIFENKPCYFPFTSLVLDYNGELRNCFYSESFGNLNTFETIDWTFEKSLVKLENSGRCKTCRGKIFCPTGKQINNQLESF